MVATWAQGYPARPVAFRTVLEASGNIKAGKLRALAVTSDKPVPALPDVPTPAQFAKLIDDDRKRYA